MKHKSVGSGCASRPGYLGVLAFSAFMVLATTSPASANATFMGLGFHASAVSPDGSTVVGGAVRWRNGVVTDLGVLPGAVQTIATAVSADGSIVVGYTRTRDSLGAFRWAGGVIASLGFLPGSTFNYATAVSADGSVIVGDSGSGPPIRWENNAISTLGIPFGFATAISADASLLF